MTDYHQFLNVAAAAYTLAPMLMNYLTTALRHLLRNRFYTGINIVGLALGLTATILIALFVRNELSYDRFLEGHERTYLLVETMQAPSQPLIVTPASQVTIAEMLELDFPSIEAVTRLIPSQRTLRQGDIEANEKIYWSDPSLASVLPLPTLRGDLRSALKRPGSVVLTQRMARKYFHDADPIGRTLEVDRQHTLQVTAVLADLPAATYLDTEIIAAGHSAFSELAEFDAHPERVGFSDRVHTFLRLAPGASIESLQAQMPTFLKRHFPGVLAAGIQVSIKLTPLADVHLAPITHKHKAMRAGGDRATLYVISIVGLLLLTVAGINFVNLMTARAGRRAIEVGIRKTSGASRRDLIIQFMGEAVLYAVLATWIAIIFVELTLPNFNAFLGQSIAFDYWRHPTVLLALAGMSLFLGVLAGTYPALLLSSFRPATVLKSGVPSAAGLGSIRRLLVVLQFSILIGLLLSTGVIYRQYVYAMNEGLRLDTDQVLLVKTACDSTFKDEVAKAPGVLAVACSSRQGLNMDHDTHRFTLRDGTQVWMSAASVGEGFFELYGLRPLAGRVFSKDHPGDPLPSDFLERAPAADIDTALSSGANVARIVINETAVRRLRLKSPSAAVGQTFIGIGGHPMEVIGVVPDFSMDTIRKVIEPVIYAIYPPSLTYLGVKLSGREIPESLQAIDQLWRTLGAPEPITRFFLNQHLQDQYRDVTRQAHVFGIFAGVAIFIACLGLVGLSAHTAERRTKEIGIRKAMGATRGNIIVLLIWQFIQPVLWANLIAWPIAAVFLSRWLNGFAYHVDLEYWLFILAGVLALVIAMGTVAVQAYQAASAHPVKALRYE